MMDTLRDDIRNNAQRLNALLNHELFRIEQRQDTRVSKEVIELTYLSLEYTKLFLKISNKDTTSQ